MSEKMEKIEGGLEDEATRHNLQERMGQSYFYNSEKDIWEAKDVIERINRQLRSHE